ncbi:MAG TPA: DUF1203 domain-containing protein [Candidatus Acidoferrales bacterium]|nr:DUF1203 domain-containing protein [Candidatus Acidoferrales bacterium]
MLPIRIVAIPTAVAESVRATLRDPVYGHVAYVEVGAESAPCRHCLRLIAAGERRILFTYDRFSGVEPLPLPGPIYIHAEPCERYPESAEFPDELRGSPRTLEGYSAGRHLVAREYVNDGAMEKALETIFVRGEVDYVLVNSTTAGCNTFRIERQLMARNAKTSG